MRQLIAQKNLSIKIFKIVQCLDEINFIQMYKIRILSRKKVYKIVYCRV